MATNAPNSSIFDWYKIDTLENIKAYPVPEFTKIETIENLTAKVWHSEMVDFSETLRTAITIAYNNVHLPLGLYDFYPYYKNGYAITLLDGIVYLGIES